MILPAPIASFARKLLLVPILLVAMYVVLVEATAAPPGSSVNTGTQAAPAPAPAWGLSIKPYAGGDARRMR